MFSKKCFHELVPNLRGVAIDFTVGVRFSEFSGRAGGVVSFYPIYFSLSFRGSPCLLSPPPKKIATGENRLGGETSVNILHYSLLSFSAISFGSELFFLVGLEHWEYVRTLSFEKICRMH